MRFVPGRHKLYPLDSAIKIIVIDESGTVPLELYELLIAALPNPSEVQFIYLGDLEQNPPVFGAAVLGFKGLEHRDNTIQLTQVYRQALESPIIRLAHRILSGRGIPEKEYSEWNVEGQLSIRAWKKKISATEAMLTMARFYRVAFENRLYDPEKDCILMTQNVNFGTNELNKHIANMYARAQGRETYEIISGFLKHYFSPGDSVMYEKEDAEIVRIEPNPKYQGKTPQPHSKSLDYFGHNSTPSEIQHLDLEEHFDKMMESNVYDDIEDRKEVASHKIFIRLKNTDSQIDENGEERLIMLDSAAEINNLALGYAMTVHKAQGSEWRKVFIVIHHSNAAMLSRELLYTAVTRAREDLTILCESESLVRGVEIQKIKGNTLEDKLNHFARKLSEKSILLK
jgi:ATP-dependent exoDNAse (exonuclease V) alpha subunit